MIHKFFVFLLVVFLATKLSAQCTPDQTLTVPGYAPDTLPYGKINVQYNQSITVRAFKDTTTKIGSTTVNVTIDSIKAIKVLGLPSGFSYTCLHPRCVFLPLKNSCVVISGVNATPGIYPFKIIVTAFAKINGTISTQRNDTISRFSITLTGTANNKNLSKNYGKLWPNPSTGKFVISGSSSVEICSLDGKKIAFISKKNELKNTSEIQLINASKGIYFVKSENRMYRLVIE